MPIIINAKVGEEIAGVITLGPGVVTHPWLDIASNPFTVVEVTDQPILPSNADAWDGNKFTSFTGVQSTPGYMYFAFIVHGFCALVQPLSPERQMSLIAAYRSGVAFEVINDEPN